MRLCSGSCVEIEVHSPRMGGGAREEAGREEGGRGVVWSGEGGEGAGVHSY